jgi:hypothetical protein
VWRQPVDSHSLASQSGSWFWPGLQSKPWVERLTRSGVLPEVDAAGRSGLEPNVQRGALNLHGK